MKTFVSAILSLMMFASVPVYAAKGILFKKDVPLAEGYPNIFFADHGRQRYGETYCRWTFSRDRNNLGRQVISAGTVFPITQKLSREKYADPDGFGTLKIFSAVDATLGSGSDAIDLRIKCDGYYRLFMSFPNASATIRLFSEYIEEVELD